MLQKTRSELELSKLTMTDSGGPIQKWFSGNVFIYQSDLILPWASEYFSTHTTSWKRVSLMH
jgi:hypothetical protein